MNLCMAGGGEERKQTQPRKVCCRACSRAIRLGVPCVCRIGEARISEECKTEGDTYLCGQLNWLVLSEACGNSAQQQHKEWKRLVTIGRHRVLSARFLRLRRSTSEEDPSGASLSSSCRKCTHRR